VNTDWWSLKYETQNGPEFLEFPYYPTAVEFHPAQQAVTDLSVAADPSPRSTARCSRLDSAGILMVEAARIHIRGVCTGGFQIARNSKPVRPDS
jgi:hypothetical protein